MSGLVLSLFPGIGLLDRAFEEEGFCIVRGPDLLWGGDVRAFHPPAGVFDGVIGGPPCQAFSKIGWFNPHAGKRHGNMIPEFERVVAEAEPAWFLMENVREAPRPNVAGYQVQAELVSDVWVGGETPRMRRFSFGTVNGQRLYVETLALHGHARSASPLAGHGPVGRGVMHQTNPPLSEMARLQGLPEDFLADAPFTVQGKRKVIGNGVPLPMGRAIARAVKRAVTGDVRIKPEPAAVSP